MVMKPSSIPVKHFTFLPDGGIIFNMKQKDIPYPSEHCLQALLKNGVALKTS
jgi:hypothetical protein